jgi:hypothetical protein
MQDQGKRLLLAVALALGVFLVWNMFAPQEPPKPPPPAQQAPKPATPDVGVAAGGSAAEAAPGAAAAGAASASAAPVVEEPRPPEALLTLPFDILEPLRRPEVVAADRQALRARRDTWLAPAGAVADDDGRRHRQERPGPGRAAGGPARVWRLRPQLRFVDLRGASQRGVDRGAGRQETRSGTPTPRTSSRS